MQRRLTIARDDPFLKVFVEKAKTKDDKGRGQSLAIGGSRQNALNSSSSKVVPIKDELKEVSNESDDSSGTSLSDDSDKKVKFKSESSQSESNESESSESSGVHFFPDFDGTHDSGLYD